MAVVVVTLTSILFTLNTNLHSEKAVREFDAIAEDSVNVLYARLQTHLLSVMGTAAFVAASDDVTAVDFKHYIDKLDIGNRLPGVTGIGFIVEVPDDGTESFMQRMRAENDPFFSLRYLSEEDTHFILKYMEPALPNINAIGLDLTFREDRSDVMKIARDTGTPRLTPPIQLVQAGGSSIGSVLYMPIYTASSVTGERGTFLGWVNATFVAEDILSDIISAQGESYTLLAYDGPSGEGGMELFQGKRDTNAPPKFTKAHQIERFGRTWTLNFSSTPKFEAAQVSYQPLSIMLTGLTLTGLLLSILRNIRRHADTIKEISNLKTRQIAARVEENRSIIENHVTAVFVLDCRDRVLFANQAAQQCFGRSASEMYMVEFALIVKTTQSTDGSYNATGQSKDGRTLELDLHRNEWVSSEGEKRSTVIFRDMTSQNTAQRELSKSKTIFDLALQGSEIGVFDINLQTGKSEVSETWCRIMGYEHGCKDLDTQQVFLARIHPEDIGTLEKADADCIAGKTARSVAEYRMRSIDGDWCWMRSNAVVVDRDAEGVALRLIGTQMDVTRLRRDRDALADSERLFRQVVDHAPIGMALMDDTGHFVGVNAAFSALSGMSQEDLIAGGRLSNMLPYDDRKALYIAISDMIKGKKGTVYSAEHRIIGPNGEERWGLLNVSWSLEKNKSQYFYIAQIIDITDQKKIDLMKDEFVSTVSHELRTPLTSIKGALGLLTAAKIKTLSHAQSRLIEIAKSNADRLTNIVNDILDLEKISSGEVMFNNDDLDMNEIIRTSVCEMSPFAVTHDCSIVVDLPDGPLPVYVDQGRTQQVLANLISNACKYSDPETDVVVRAEMINDLAIIYVQNTGPGVPKAFRSRIFQPFSQADSSDTRANGGTGLGLNISRQIVLRQGGQIGFESVPGGLTVFWFTVPLADGVEDKAHVAKQVTDAAKDMITILHVESDNDFAEVLAGALKGFGDVKHAKSLAVAQQIIAGERLDVVILDWSMPDGDASELINQIKMRQPDAKIIGLTSTSKQSSDPRLFAHMVKSQTDLGAVVDSITRCVPLAS
ncbi:Multi-sensor Signal Transduction Histidine Kinase [Sulfitobacter guttiformis KCTC 32187]|nr:Multi-sensor Signal Transduction Histidine Kinase [Sulfitobacter guttiformis KCTC 32187]